MDGDGYGTGEAVFTILVAVYFIFIGVIFLLAVVVYVLNGFAFTKLFRKVGIEPWAAWVPFFNIWRILELGGQYGWLCLLSLISPGAIVTLVFECIAVHRIGLAFRKTGSWVVLFVFLPFVWAWLLAADNEHYDPTLVAQHGYGPPLVGHGSVRGPYVPQTYAPPAA